MFNDPSPFYVKNVVVVFLLLMDPRTIKNTIQKKTFLIFPLLYFPFLFFLFQKYIKNSLTLLFLFFVCFIFCNKTKKIMLGWSHNYTPHYLGKDLKRRSGIGGYHARDNEGDLKVGMKFSEVKSVRRFRPDLATHDTVFGKLTLLTSARLYVAICKRGSAYLQTEKYLDVVGIRKRPRILGFTSTVRAFLDAILGSNDYQHLDADNGDVKLMLKMLDFKKWDHLLELLPYLEAAFMKIVAGGGESEDGKTLILACFYVRLMRWESRGFDARQKFISRNTVTEYDYKLAHIASACMHSDLITLNMTVEERMTLGSKFAGYDNVTTILNKIPFLSGNLIKYGELLEEHRYDLYYDYAFVTDNVRHLDGEHSVRSDALVCALYLAGLDKIQSESNFDYYKVTLLTHEGTRRHMGAAFYALVVMCADEYFMIDEVAESTSNWSSTYAPTYNKVDNTFLQD
jgi:hypothetical protein